MKQKFTIIKLFIVTGNILIPVYAFVLCITTTKSPVDIGFFIFISACIIERAWETFRTSKETRRDELHGDWTLVAVTGTYLALYFLFLTEYYLVIKTPNLLISCFGFVLWGLSFRLRFWGMAALGKQWAVHAVGVQKIKKVRLIKLGPYKYIRHPIYAGIILEVLSYPIIANAYYSLVFAGLICVPLVIIRAWTEEKTSLRRFANQYSEYKQEVGMIFPKQHARRILLNG